MTAKAMAQHIASAALNYRWHILVVAALTAFVLGCVGYWQYFTNADGTPPAASDAIYWSLRTFLTYAPLDPHLPLALDIARFLGPAVAGYAGLEALTLLFRDRLQQMRATHMRGHVIICGLGYIGATFLRELDGTGTKVVAVDIDAANPHIELCRALGVPVVVGDARLPRVLQAAGVHRAARLLAVTPDDALNAEIVAVARRLSAARRRGRLRCLARVGDPELCVLLRVHEARRAGASSTLDFFNTEEIGARLMLRDVPIDTDRSSVHIIVADLNALGSWVVYHAAQAWFETHRGDHQSLIVSVVDEMAADRISALLSTHPALGHVCRFIISGREADSPAIPPPSRAYVAAYRDQDGLTTALRLRYELDDGVPVVVALDRTDGVAGLLDDARHAGAYNIHVFPTLERSCSVGLVEGGSFETIAEAIHRRWRTETAARGVTAPPWSEADKAGRESSRAQARHIPVKLRAIGCEVTPLRDWAASQFELSASEVETLAAMEHDRWRDERRSRPSKDERTDSGDVHMVPFDELPGEIAEMNRAFVRDIPGLLASAGLQLVRAPELARVRHVEADNI
ncbi:hypothetical protein AU196_14565 [Mycobacterium sp. IS-1742]|uniref:potassium channel family protein n=1 Tax=Mycobacterium sp. IS-1742 TaxID=1772285 RepID=UPI00073FC897|nr:NAD(P)-binding protein [Mycobacterium sp. IS-1742]KUI28925.1 hypothetical protein AU196_14565 [Mycobacterium sp. IS-1742]